MNDAHRPSWKAAMWKDLGGIFLYYPGSGFVARAPETLIEPLARLGGQLVQRLGGSGDREAREELALLFGDRSLPGRPEEIVAASFRIAMRNELEVLRYARLDEVRIDDVCLVEGREHLDKALERGRGAIVVIGHFGANQMVMPALGHKGYPMHQLSAPPPVWAEILRDRRTTRLWKKVLERRWALEQRLPVRHINVFRFLRPAFQCLQDNEVLGIAFDGGAGTGWTQVDLLARKANVSTQPIQIWRKSGAALLPAVVVRPPGAKVHRIIIEPELTFERAADRDEEDRRNMQAFTDRFSRWVERYPDHYLPFILLRRRVRGTDVRPFFEGWPQAEDALGPDEAEARIKRAGAWRG